MIRDYENVLVIDQATIKTSYTILSIRDGQPFWTECSKIILDQPEYQDRILELYRKLSDIIVEKDITKIVIEQVPPIVNNFHTTSVLLKLMGSIELLCREKGIVCEIMNIQHWKKACGITSKGRLAQKKASVNLAWNRWVAYRDIIKDSDDVADCLNMSYVYLMDEGYIK